MKRTIVIAAVLMLLSAFIIYIMSSILTEKWQAPENDSSEIIYNPTVNELLGDKFKVYKYIESDFEYQPEYEEGMITPLQAAAFGGNAVNAIEPYDWEEKEFIIGRVSVGASCGVMYTGYYDTGEQREVWYYLNGYTGQVVQLTFKSAQKITPMPLMDLLNQQKEDKEKILYIALDAAEKLGYEDICGHVISSQKGRVEPNEHIVYLDTESDEQLQIIIYTDSERDYKFYQFTNITVFTDKAGETEITENNDKAYYDNIKEIYDAAKPE